MLEHFHAGDDIEAARLLSGQCLGTDLAVLHAARACFECMKLRHFERLAGQVDTQHFRALASHRIGQDATAAADIEHSALRYRRNTVNPFQTQWIDFVQRAEFAFQIPPAMGQF